MSGLDSILNYSLSGMQSAKTQFIKSANKVVSAGLETPVEDINAVESSELPVPAVAGVTDIGTASTAYVANEEVYAGELVNMQIAKSVYQMGIAAYKTANEMSEEAISMIRQDT